MVRARWRADGAVTLTRDEMRERLAEWALKQHSDGVREDGSTNDGEPMRRYALHGEAPLSWCARMVRAGLLVVGPRDLYEMGSARFLYAWLLEHGAERVDAAQRQTEAGDLRFLLGRGGSDPLTASGKDGGIHHVGVGVGWIGASNDGRFRIVDGNWGDRVSLNVETVDDPRSLWLRWPV